MPDAILLQDVESIGEKGTVVTVSKGYLRNYLIPRKLAAPATKGLVDAARRKVQDEERARIDAETRANEYAALLFGSVTNQDIADAIKEARGVTVDKRKVHLEDPIKAIGTYQVVVEIAEGVHATVKTIVTER